MALSSNVTCHSAELVLAASDALCFVEVHTHKRTQAGVIDSVQMPWRWIGDDDDDDASTVYSRAVCTLAPSTSCRRLLNTDTDVEGGALIVGSC
jgi:hypothetical protein